MCKNIVIANGAATTATTLREASDGKPVSSKLFYEPSSIRTELANADKKDGSLNGGSSSRAAGSIVTMEQVTKKTEEGRLCIIIHDNVYDVTDYKDKHPGGHLVLQHLSGKDATDAFENYHRAHVAKFLLPRYHVGKLAEPRKVAPHVQDFRLVRQELLQRGLYEVPSAYYAKLYLWFATLFVASLYLTLACSSVASHMMGAVLMGLFWQQFAGLGHDLGHSAVSKRFSDDHWFGSVIGASLTGLSTAWWKSSHNTHHVVPNSVEHDPDIQHLPLMAISEQVIEESYWSTYHNKMFHMDRLATFFVGYQHLLFFPLMFLARFNLYAQGLIFLLTRTDDIKTPFRRHELVCILGVFLVWYLAVALTLSTWMERVTWVLLSHAVTALLHFQIVISHWSRESYRDTDESSNKKKDDDLNEDDWYRRQLRTTMDISCPEWMDFFHIGLQFQTTHHLFPALPRPHLRVATQLVKKVCQKHGIEFCEKGFFSMMGDSLKALSDTAAAARSGKYTARSPVWEAWNAEG
eukprot:scaffold14441_cov249-Amphora_coffeaeformis.AAC.2